MVQFALENCIKTVLEAKGITPPQAFYKSAKRIIGVAQIPDPHRKTELLQIPARIRNALHRNGVHSTGTVPAICVDGAIYEFRKGQRLDCASWSHLFHIVLHALGIYAGIFSSNAVATIKYIPSN